MKLKLINAMNQENDKKKKIPIVFSADNIYSMPLGIALISIFENKKKDHEIKIYVLDSGISDDNKDKLKIIEKNYKFKINYLKIDISKFNLFTEKRYFTKAIYYRLLAPNIINEEKIIYLDCDVIVASDLMDLYKTDLKNKTIAAVKDRSEEYVKKYSFYDIKNYFNSGVLLMNVKRWKKENIWQKSLKFLKENREKFKYPDQDLLNFLFENQWLKINKNFNFQLDKHQELIKDSEIKILHFVGARKPWHYLYNNPYKKYFLKYLKISPWADYRYPDKNLKIFLQKYLLEPIFLVFKKIIKKTAPKSVVKIMKNIFWYFSNLRDSR